MKKMNIPFVTNKRSIASCIRLNQVINYLKILSDYKDNDAFKEILNAPKRGLGEACLRYIVKAAEMNKISLFEACVALKRSNFAVKITGEKIK